MEVKTNGFKVTGVVDVLGHKFIVCENGATFHMGLDLASPDTKSYSRICAITSDGCVVPLDRPRIEFPTCIKGPAETRTRCSSFTVSQRIGMTCGGHYSGPSR